MTRSPLHRHLVVLALAGMLPLAVLAGVGLLLVYRQQLELAQQRSLEVTRALAAALESELQRSIAALQVFAAAGSLRRGDVAEFDGAVRRGAPTQPNWRNVILTDAQGVPLVNTRLARGEPLPPVIELESLREAVATRTPRIGTLARGPRDFAFAIRVPVVVGDEVRYVVSAVVEPGAFVRIIQRQKVPDSWVISVFDASGQRIARSRAHEKFLGAPASEPLRALLAMDQPEGIGESRTVEGDDVLVAYTRVPVHAWVVTIGVPVSEVTAPARRSAAIYAGAVALSLLAGWIAVLVVARRINRPIAQLREGAALLGRGGEPAAPDTGIRELREVGEAMALAARQRQAIEAEREKLLQSEHAARMAAEEANSAKDKFLAMLAHELRNPLAALSNATALINHAGSDPRMTGRAHAVIQRQVSHLARLTDDLLDTAGAILGRLTLRSEPVDLARVAAESLSTFASTGRMDGHRVSSALAAVCVLGDEMRLEQIIGNLLVNAVKYTPPGGTIKLETAREGRDAVIRVTDDGLGMSPELARRAFDLFVQGDRAANRAQGGLGIGLTLVRRLAELHGGTVEVHSEGEQRGSCFTVRIPAIDVAERQFADRRSSP